jgi:hypothetical protein
MKKSLLLLIIPLFLSACMKDRTFNIVLSGTDKEITPGMLVINEICSSGSTYTNEFGGTSPDWFEIYNPGSDSVTLVKDHWYVTDDQTLPFKYDLPRIIIPPHKFFVVCCDGIDSIATQIHTNFSLSSNGESVGLYYKTDGGPFILIDDHTFGSATASVSFGRIPDGSSNWTTCTLMTPGTPNQ